MSATPDQTPGKVPAAAPGVSRRRFLQGVGIAGAGAVIADPVLRGADAPPAAGDAASAAKTLTGPSPITLTVNGQPRPVTVEPRTTLLSALRDAMDPPITGPKFVCGAGTCGACTVLLDGKNVYSCLVLAVDAVGKQITTVEGLGSPDKLNAVQQAFVEKDAMMCGFCTSGFVTTVTRLVDRNPHLTEQELREGCKGNFCRCGTYPHIFEAAMAAAKQKATANG